MASESTGRGDPELPSCWYSDMRLLRLALVDVVVVYGEVVWLDLPSRDSMCGVSPSIYPSSSLPLTLPSLVACKLAVRASIFLSSSATLLSVFFCLFRLGAVMTHLRFAFRHLLQGPVPGSGSHLTLSPRHASQALGRLVSLLKPTSADGGGASELV